MKKNKRRKRADPVNYTDYGASVISSQLSDLQYFLNSPEEDIENNKEILMGRSIQLAMVNSLAIAALKRFRTNIVGTGLKLKSIIDPVVLGITEEEAENIENSVRKHF